MRTTLDVVGCPKKLRDEKTRERVERRQEKQKTYADVRRACNDKTFQMGQSVKTKGLPTAGKKESCISINRFVLKSDLADPIIAHRMNAFGIATASLS